MEESIPSSSGGSDDSDISELDSHESTCACPQTFDKEPTKMHTQVPIAIVGMACRLPGHCKNPKDLWDFMMQGKVAANEPPATRFNLSGHFDSSRKPYTMKTPGAMFMEDVDPADFDAQFFNINFADAKSMDPQQRGLMEVTYECLENAGIPIETLEGCRVGCLVGASAVDYHDMNCRDPEDRVDSPTLGTGRALLSNRISHFLNVHGPSISIDTACSSTLTALDMACLYLGANQVDAMLVAGANMYLSPERNQDMGAMRATASPSGRCHAFDSKADGYVCAEALNVVFLKRLNDAVRDHDPIRAVIRGTSVNSAGKTPGIAMPDAHAQAAAIRSAYANAGIPEEEFGDTGYLECHGTGTPRGDPIEVEGVASVFALARPLNQPLPIGSVKSNVGHSEAAAGISGLIKAVLAVESGTIPGTATFITPNPRIDFEKSRVKAFRKSIKWPKHSKKRASINSFGFGGANAHVVIENAQYLLGDSAPWYKTSYVKNEDIGHDFFDDEETAITIIAEPSRPKIIVLSANDADSLGASIEALSAHLLNPGVTVSLGDLAYTLSERRSQLYHRAYSIQAGTQLSKHTFVLGKRWNQPVRIGFVFTGQGAQWPMMGKQLLESFSEARKIVEGLDRVLATLPESPNWTLIDALTQQLDPAILRQPEFSQPIVTALQLAYLGILSSWGIKPQAVVGHSSGEIAAAVAAGFLSPEEAIKVAFLRGQAAKQLPPVKELGMLAVGIPAQKAEEYIDPEDDLVQIACYNSPQSLTLSGTVKALERVKNRVQKHNHFARMLQVNFAYHSGYMDEIGKKYFEMLQGSCGQCSEKCGKVSMFSSVTGGKWESPTDSTYWTLNMMSQVQFHQAVSAMLEDENGANFLIEIGPSNALAGPISQIFESLSHAPGQSSYISIAKRNSQTLSELYDAAGKLVMAGGTVDLSSVNEYDITPPSVLVDLPNYAWNHSKKYWHESLASKDWRFRPFAKHDLLGTKILGASWRSPSFRNALRLDDSPWLRDHKLGDKVVFPGAAYICMAMEAMYQASYMTAWMGDIPTSYKYLLRDIKFLKALILDDSDETAMVMLSLAPASNSWYEFTISATKVDISNNHATGFIRIESDVFTENVSEDAVLPIRHPMTAGMWYKSMRGAGFNFGPCFQKLLLMEYTEGSRKGRSTVSLEAPASKWTQSSYSLHPACMDGCFQTMVSSAWAGDRSSIITALVPSQIDSLVVPFRAQQPNEAISAARSDFIGVGRKDLAKNYASSCSVYRPEDGSLVLELKGLRYTELDSSNDAALSHTYTQLVWDVDVGLLTETSFRQLADAAVVDLDSGTSEQTRVVAQRLLDLVAHKNPNLRILEINFDPEDSSSLWLNKSTLLVRTAFTQYKFLSTNASSVVAVQEGYAGVNNAEFGMLDLDNIEGHVTQKYDLVIAKFPIARVQTSAKALKAIQSCLALNGVALMLHSQEHLDGMERLASTSGFQGLWQWGPIALARIQTPAIDLPYKDVFLVHFAEVNEHEIRGTLCESSFTIVSIADARELPAESTVLVVDELYQSVLSKLDQRQWDIVQILVEKKCKLLWVTKGAHMWVTDPTKALASGLFRTIRNENPFLTIINLDVEYSSGDSTLTAIDTCLSLLDNVSRNEREFVERGGVMYVSRVLPDVALNRAKEEQVTGSPAEAMDLHASEGIIRLWSERIGNLDSLHYNEISTGPLPLDEGCAEIEVFASGVNFKDVASTLGIVPENECLLGGEGSGIITRLASDVTNFQKGQRVVFFKKGSFGNRVQATTQVIHTIPDSMSFEDASTIPCVFMTAMYSLFNLAGMKKGDRVLIHSATGGVGIAAIQLCVHVGVVIYATVGTQEKRDFLTSRYGIPDERIFSSRTRAFGRAIMEHTGGKGVNVILNSLAGELLDESWRIIADGGTMVELGKKDILDRNTLAMEPFNRNASYRALDLSHDQISDDIVASLLFRIFELLNHGHIDPISPIRTFSFANIPDALRLIRSAKHIGKIIISDGPDAKVQVPVRHIQRNVKFRDDVCYLICGGLRGLCSSLAIYMATHGARYLAVMSRSGYDDPNSQKVVHDIRANGCEIELIRGDITSIDDVRKAFEQSRVPIGGLVQGTMVLRDRTFASMTVEEYHAALECKLKGTWNLHEVSIEKGFNLDFFTLLSSIAGIYGSPGQANYAAGNTFLDSFASYRQSLGLVACSVDLGVVEDVGYMNEHDDLQGRYDSTIWHGINERLLRKIFAFSVLQQQTPPINPQSSSHMITGIQSPQPEDSPLLRDSRFAGLYLTGRADSLQNRGRDGAKDCQALLIAVRSKANAKTVLDMAVEVLNTYLTKTLRMTEPLDRERPLSIYGIDSLAAIEFRNFVKVELGVELVMLDILDAVSLVSLCEKIVSRMAEA